MVELEELNDYRFYKLKPVWLKWCECGGLLWLHMKNGGGINQGCKHVGCGREYEVARECTYCGTKHDFDDVTCDNCEQTVIDYTTWKVAIDECGKAIKKINRQYKLGVLSEGDWISSTEINQREIKECQKSLRQLEETGICQYTI